MKVWRRRDDEDYLPVPTEADLDRIASVWRGLARNRSNFVFSPADMMAVWSVEHRVRSERQATARLTFATWVLVFSTMVLALATIALVFVTVGE